METEKVRDPVCGMLVDPEQLVVTFEGMRFAFCSEQCREHFLANPHLYIGKPGEPAPKQSGQLVLKRRRLHLDKPLTSAQAEEVADELRAMMGVTSIDISGNEISITYDLLQSTAGQIEGRLQQAGERLGQGWSVRLQRAFIHFLEESEVASREVRPDPHGHSGHRHS